MFFSLGLGVFYAVDYFSLSQINQFGIIGENFGYFIFVIYFIIAWFIRKIIKDLRLGSIVDEAEKIAKRYESAVKRYESEYSAINSGRDFLENFGQGFGEGYSQARLEQGDALGTLIGQGISFIAGEISNLTKTNSQSRIEIKIEKLYKKLEEYNSIIEKEKSNYFFCVIGIFFVCLALAIKINISVDDILILIGDF